MSGERSSSGVRNLRTLFENKSNDNTDPSRGRSPSGLGADLDNRPRSKVRASFFAVESPTPATYKGNMASAPDFSKVPNNNVDALAASDRETNGRRSSFSENVDSSAVQQLKNTVADEAKRRESVPVAETIPETAVETPSAEPDKQLGKKDSEKKETPLRQELKADEHETADKEAENPDKPVTGAEEEPADMKSAQPTSEAAVSGGDALPAVVVNLRKSVSSNAGTKPGTTKAAPKPAQVSTKSAPRQSTTTVKSPRLTSTSSVTSPTSTSSRAGRSSLTAPTAASVARAGKEAAATSSKPTPAASKPKPREVTKPVDIPSRLTAPTAASRAKYEAPPAPSKPVASNKTKPPPTTDRSARPSLGRPESRGSSHAAPRKTTAPVDSSFLERMSRPTAASSNRLKPEEKSQPKTQKLPTRPKPNGHAKTANTAKTTAAEAIEESTFVEEPSVAQEGEHIAEPIAQAQEAAAENRGGSPATEFAPHTTTVEATGKETPSTNGRQDNLEGTPAALGVGDSIR